MLDAVSRSTLQNASVLFVCEGSCERIIIETLLTADKLVVDESNVIRDDIADRPTTNCRAARTVQETFLGYEYDNPVAIVRILDSRRERFRLSYPYNETVPVFSCYTTPEIEMLAIIKEDALNRYNKRAKSKTKPSDFCKKELGLSRIKNEEFLHDYWSDADELCQCLTKYRSIHKAARKDELVIADLLK
ncbi:hypothetical protein [Bifidobacterium tissieri]|uniref:Uncharacterized protein n=1 Tax=Bifidobacterium tissieri TaxID=1630162 RepID=A0A5M9ZJW0_9BIFI|nr:hypothetical protein [Bifidobacterium tissieri]KAA8827906.1 hypothetical protein EMO89_09700 [Bifidobacterium tissieri]KAA8830880.1 hypothetical protein EM849_08960 [Bifidobacterium tissieri]